MTREGERGSAGRDPRVDRAAAEWFARMHGPEREAVRPEFEQWRSRDPAHRAAYAEAERLWQVSAGLARTELGRTRNLSGSKPSIWSLPARQPALAALAAVILVVIGLVALQPFGTEPGELVATATAAERTRVGEVRTIALADGSSVTLDTDSAIEIELSQAGRRVRLSRGRARFDVAPDPVRPFRVEADGRLVTARGTLFDVGFEPGGVRVTLLRGSVEVRGRAAAGAVASVARLSPGQCFSDAGRGPVVAPAPRGIDQWVAGMLSFDGTPLGDVLAQTNRYSERKIRLGDPSLAALRVTGAFNPLPADALASSLAATFGLRVVRTPAGDFILRRK